jgi:hypothetical protein
MVTITGPDVKAYMVFECLKGLFITFVGACSPWPVAMIGPAWVENYMDGHSK